VCVRASVRAYVCVCLFVLCNLFIGKLMVE